MKDVMLFSQSCGLRDSSEGSFSSPARGCFRSKLEPTTARMGSSLGTLRTTVVTTGTMTVGTTEEKEA